MKYSGLNEYIEKLEFCKLYPCYLCKRNKYVLYQSMVQKSIYNTELNKVLMISWFDNDKCINQNNIINCFKEIFSKYNNFNVSYITQTFDRFYKGILFFVYLIKKTEFVYI